MIGATPHTQDIALPLPNAMRLLLGLLYLRLFSGAAAALGLPDGARFVTLALAGAAALVFLADPRIARPTALALLGFALWLVACALSLAFAPPLAMPDLAATQVVLLVLYGAMLNGLALHLRGPAVLAAVRRFLGVFILTGAALALYQTASGTGFAEAGRSTYLRAFGPDVHPVSFGLQLVVALVGLEIARLRGGARLGAGMIALYLLGGAALYLSFARTAWVALLLVVLLMVWSRSRPALRVTLLPPVAGAGVLLALASGRFNDLASLSFFLDHYDFSASTYDFRYVDNSLSWRIANWAMGLRLALEQPLTGHGPAQAVAVSAFGLQMHNLFLEALVELGVPGLIAVVLVVTGLGRMRRHIPQSDPNARAIRALLGALGLGFLLTITLSTSLVGQTMTVMLLLMVLALSIAPIGPAEGSPDAG